MAGLPVTVTSAGLAALINAQQTGASAAVIAQLGVSATHFEPTILTDALPDEIKRLDAVAGQVTSEDTIHVSALDATTDVYAIRSIALYLDTGVLLAVYSQAEVLANKASASWNIVDADIRFFSTLATGVAFLGGGWVNPPASETNPGVLRLATAAEALAGVDPAKAMTPLRTKALVDQVVAAARARLVEERRGDMVFRATQTVPDGAYECDGRAVSRTGDDAPLFAIVGTAFGEGDGVTTFNIPDMRGEFPRGWDHGRGVDAGRVFGSAQEDMLAAHDHALPARNNANAGDGWIEDADGSAETRTTRTGTTGGVETRPRNVAGLWIIWR